MLNKTHVHNKATLIKYLDKRQGKPLITVSNHYSMVDDCLIQCKFVKYVYK